MSKVNQNGSDSDWQMLVASDLSALETYIKQVNRYSELAEKAVGRISARILWATVAQARENRKHGEPL